MHDDYSNLIIIVMSAADLRYFINHTHTMCGHFIYLFIYLSYIEVMDMNKMHLVLLSFKLP